MIPHSIRGRLLLWFTCLLAGILGGFGVTAYQLNRRSELERVDEALQRRVTLLQTDLREADRPPGPGGGRIAGPFPPPPEGRMPWPKTGGPDDGGARPMPPERGRFPGFPERRGPRPDFEFRVRELKLTEGTAAMFNEADASSYYYAAWSRGGTLIGKSRNAPADLPLPEFSETGRSYQQSRGQWREVYHVTERSDVVLVGISVVPMMRANRQFAWLLAGAGLGVLLVGIGGGWVMITRSLRPVREIGATARRIAAGDLSGRINVEDARSELGDLGRVLNSTFARLEAAFADQKNFTADASHELRTPLAVILTEAQRALARERTAEEYRATIAVCRDTARDMRKLTESLLELARLDAGQEPMQREPVDLAEVAAGAAERLRPLIAERRISLLANGVAAPASADPARLQQVAMNLLQNAIRYNRDGGEIRLQTGSTEKEAWLAVSDTGEGIAAEDLPRVFERFYRADKARTRAQGGIGLGLSICKAIVDSHGGTIDVASEPGKGTTFTLRLPR